MREGKRPNWTDLLRVGTGVNVDEHRVLFVLVEIVGKVESDFGDVFAVGDGHVQIGNFGQMFGGESVAQVGIRDQRSDLFVRSLKIKAFY